MAAHAASTTKLSPESDDASSLSRKLVAARPLAEISVAELARRAGVSRDTVYRHATSVMTD